MSSRPSLLVALLSLPLAAGCATYTSPQSARALEPGEYEFTAAFGIDRAGAERNVIPTSQIGGRLGVANGVDVGLTLTTFAAQVSSTVQLLRSPWVDLALAPAFEAGKTANFDDENVSYGMAKLPLLVGFNFGERSQFVLGPTLIGLHGSAAGVEKDQLPPGDFGALLLGGTATLKLAPLPHLGFYLLSAVFVPVAGSAIPSMGALTPQIQPVPDSQGRRPVIFQFGAGISFGGGHAGSR